jgi:hypothetical protein
MDNLIGFFERFFSQIKSEVRKEGNCLNIFSVPQSFEKFSGRKSPYKFSFDGEKEGYEFISENHYLIKTIKEFLEGHGETALLRAKFDIDLKEELQKCIPFMNSKIKSINKLVLYDRIIQFLFSTTFRYLNESKTIINKVFIRDGKIVEMPKIEKFSEGDKKDLQEIIIENEYAVAKEEIKKIISPEIENLKKELNSQLSEEILRIENLYEENLKDFKEKEKTILKQIENNQEDEDKRKKFEKRIENLNEENNLKKISEEKEEFIQKEIKKYGLKIENKLVNTTIICVPIYRLNLTLELEKDNLKIIEIIYNPLEKKINPIYCKSCGKELKEIILCSSGHLTCRECGDKCPSCGGIFCKSCFVRECNECGRKICQRCQNICSSCGKVFCNMHIKNVNGRKICRSCERKINEIKRY